MPAEPPSSPSGQRLGEPSLVVDLPLVRRSIRDVQPRIHGRGQIDKSKEPDIAATVPILGDHALPKVGATVGDLMSRPVLTVSATESLWEAWQLLFLSGLRHLVVLDGEECIGVLSDRLMLSDLPLTPEHLSRRSVADVLPRVPRIRLTQDMTVTQAAAIFTHYAEEALPVVDANNHLAGVLTGADVLAWLARTERDTV